MWASCKWLSSLSISCRCFTCAIEQVFVILERLYGTTAAGHPIEARCSIIVFMRTANRAIEQVIDSSIFTGYIIVFGIDTPSVSSTAKRVLQLASDLVTDVVDLQARRLLQIHNALVPVHYLPLFYISLCNIHYLKKCLSEIWCQPQRKQFGTVL